MTATHARLIALLTALALVMALASLSPAAQAAKDEDVTLNFVDVEISAVAKFISEITGKNLIYDERVKGKVTIVAPTKIKPAMAYDLFSSVLQMKGFTLSPAGGDTFKIIPASDARQGGGFSVGGAEAAIPRNENFVARLIPLTYLSADEVQKLLQPIVSRNGYIAVYGPSNMLMVIDSGANVEKILKLVDSLDNKPSSTEDAEVYTLENAEAASIVAMVNEAMTKSATKRGARSTAQALVESRLNALLLMGTPAERDSMRALVKLIDIPARREQVVTNVYFLENAEATEMASVLANMVKAVPKTGAPPGAPQSAPRGNTDITITPDKGTNALVIMASAGDYEALVKVIKLLDRRRRQVYVEAMIVEASLDKLKEAGARWRAVARNNGQPIVIGGVGNVGPDTMGNIINGLSGFSAGGFGNYFNIPTLGINGTSNQMTIPGFAALFNLSEFKGVVNVLSSPQILTADNTEAEIVVGENVPFVTRRDTTTTSIVSSAIERKDVGISLRITPQITEGENVRLSIYQEISSVKDTSEKVFTEVGPSTTKRSTRTSVVVRDNQTVVIGGLMQETKTDSETGVPLLSQIPLLGWLFKYKSVEKTKTNLMVFLTPHIVKDAETLAALTAEKEREYSEAEKLMVPDEMYVSFHAEVGEDRAIEVISEADGVVIMPLGAGKYHIRVPEGANLESFAKRLSKYAEVRTAEPIYRIDKLH